MSLLTTLLWGAALFFLVGSGLPLLGSDHWTVRLFDYPRVQIAMGSAATLGGLLALGPTTLVEYGLLGLLAVALVYQVDCILPYTPLAARQVEGAAATDGADRLSLLICNVEMDNRNPDPLLDQIAEAAPDVVLLLEVDGWWREHLAPLADAYPHTVERPQENAYGMALYARRPLEEAEVRYLVEDDVPSIHARLSLASGRVVSVHGLHPRPPHPTRDPDTTERDAELIHLARTLQDHDEPTIVAGDLNDVSWSYTTRLFQNLSGLLDPRIGRGLYSTFHARYPLFRYPLDHAFHSSHFKLRALQVLSYVGSDHFPVYIDLQYEPAAPLDQPEPTADAADEAQAEHELDKLRQKHRANPDSSHESLMSCRRLTPPAHRPPFASSFRTLPTKPI
jgi:endonuclease/exonuclease/phosphatase (EEP) superfamily protein YafD